MLNPLQFRLKADATTYYYYEAGNVFTTIDVNDNRINLMESYDNWDDTEGTYTRQLNFPGVIRKSAPDLVKFYNNGAMILRYVRNTQGGTEAKCYLEINVLNSTTLTYVPWDTFQIDFGAKYESRELDVDVMLIEGGLKSLLQAYSSTTFPIPLTNPLLDPDTSLVWLDGVKLLGVYNYQQLNADSTHRDIEAHPSGSLIDPVEKIYTIPLVYVDQEGAYAVAATKNVLMGVPVPGGTFGDAWCAKVIKNFTGTIKSVIDFQEISNGSWSSQKLKLQMRVRVYDAESWDDVHKIVDQVVWEDPAGYIDFSGTNFSPTSTAITTPFTRDYNEGEYIMIGFAALPDTFLTSAAGSYLKVVTKYVDPAVNPTYVPPATTINFEFLQDPTPTRALTHWQVFKKLVNKLTNGQYQAKSDLLTTDVYPDDAVWGLNPKNTYFTSGDAIRQLHTGPDGTPADPELKITLDDFVKDAFVSLCAGIGIEKDNLGNTVLALEHYSYFFKKDQLIADLGTGIRDLRISSYMEDKVNNIKAGYKDQTYDEVNGRFETNVQAEWKTSITNDDSSDIPEHPMQDADWTSPFRTDPYGIEYTRANLSSKKTTDSSSDNDVFKLQSNGNTLAYPGFLPYPYQLDRAQTVTAGLPAAIADSIFNLPFTPKREMLRMLPLMKSVYGDTPAPNLTFQTSTKNKALAASMYTGSVVTESESIDLTPVGDVLYIPTVFSFTTDVNKRTLSLIEARPYGVFRFTVIRGNNRYVLEGFILEVTANPAFSKSFDFKLLCSPNTPVPAFL